MEQSTKENGKEVGSTVTENLFTQMASSKKATGTRANEFRANKTLHDYSLFNFFKPKNSGDKVCFNHLDKF
jgi:hypothetical protein